MWKDHLAKEQPAKKQTEAQKQELSDQIVGCVQWKKSIEFMLSSGVANFYEITHLVNDSISKNISTKCLIETQIKIMRVMMPFMPHVASECLSKLLKHLKVR